MRSTRTTCRCPSTRRSRRARELTRLTTTSGCAVGLAGTFRLLGGSVATAIYTAITNSTFASHLPGEVARAAPGFANMSALLKAAATNTAAAYKAVPGITAEVISATQMAVKLSYVQAYRTTYLSALGFGGLAIIAAFLTKSTDVGMKNNTRIVRLENEKSKSEEEITADRT